MLIENFKTGTLEKWGLGYEEVLKERYPRLIHCRITGFGGDGPLGGGLSPLHSSSPLGSPSARLSLGYGGHEFSTAL